MQLVIDTSALASVVFGEADASAMAAVIAANVGDLNLSAATLVESEIVVESRQGPAALNDLRILLRATAVTIVPVDAEQASLAAAAWRRFGKGRHPAGLNLGDCFSYALSKHLGAPLLFKGKDFAQTDVTSVL
ncbi:MAG: type II toxin-antitoxin system VapC family toxin [Microlunatus sp.]